MEYDLLGLAELELSTVTFWEVAAKKCDFPVLVSVWYTVGSPGYSWGFQVDGNVVRYVTSANKGYKAIYQHDMPIDLQEGSEVYAHALKKTHQAVLRCAVENNFITLFN